MRKKSLALLAVLALSIVTLTTFAGKPLKIGDVIGKIYYSDIKTFVDGKPISSVNVGGKTMITVEDLQYMGYHVEWNAADRTLKVTSNASHNILGKVIIPDGKVAPKGGLAVEIAALVNPNPDPSAVSLAYGPEYGEEVKYIIPEGQSTLDYKISVPVKFKPHFYTAILPNGELGEPVKAPEVKPNYILRFRYSYYLGNYKVEHGDYRKGYLDMSTGDKTDIDYTFVNIDLK